VASLAVAAPSDHGLSGGEGKGEQDLVVQVEQLAVEFRSRRGTPNRAVRDVSFEILPGEIVGLVGESGSGKSATASSLLGLLPAHNAHVRAKVLRVAGVDVLSASRAQLSDLRGGQAGMVFQDPLRALTPTLRVGKQIEEVLRRHRGMSRSTSRDAAVQALTNVGIPSPEARAREYPHQFSGGQRQRILLAIAIASRPRLLIADEPTTALDVTTQSQILDLILELRASIGMAVLMISHDLAVIARLCDRVFVMYGGRLVEIGPAIDVFEAPQHPYTAGLLRSVPRIDRPFTEIVPIPGEALDASSEPPGCPFAPRCTFAAPACDVNPPLSGKGNHASACWFPLVHP